jgi:hypothetical protein
MVFGQASGFSAAMDLSTLNGSNGFRVVAESAYDYSSVSFSKAGDVNGDGFDDLFVHAFGFDSNGASSATYVVFGKASAFDAALDLSSLGGSNGFRLDGEAADDFPGGPVSAGDVNGDGFDDLIVGDSGAGPNGTDSGSSYVVFGKASGFDAPLDLSSLDGSNGFRLDGETANDHSGGSVSNAGDVNGDGFDDVIIGASGANDHGYYASGGTSYVVFGKASGFSAAMNLSNLDGTNGFILTAGAGGYDDIAFNSAGDVNGDGFSDLMVGEYRANPNGYESGSSHVVFGKASGFDATVNIPTLGRDSDLRLDGAAAGDAAGRAVSNAGDINGDGFDDVLVGAPFADSNGERSGSSYIIFGRSDFGSGLPEILGTSGDDTLTGTSADERFEAGDGNDKLIGRGGADRFEGGTGNDKIQVADLSFASVDGGTGIDVLHLAGTGLNLNLADSGDRISGIEIISLYSQGDRNTLTLTAADLRDLSNTTNTLKVNGNAGGHIIVEDSGWVDGGNRGDGYYHEYMQGDAVLLVGQNLTVDFVAA